jgi:uncharacterized protein (TIGR02145 family)
MYKKLIHLSIIIFLAGFFSCTKENTKPNADFSINPPAGNDETIFMFDAGSSSDLEDNTEDLMVIWDWEGDGFFDTQYATRKTADHIYVPGEYMVTLVVKDPRGLTDTAVKALTVISSNLPPEIPDNPSPAEDAEEIRISLNLSWDCSDPDGDYVLYNIYFGTTDPPELFLTSHAQRSFNPGKLEYKTTYYWKVTARDTEGNSTEGPTWKFSTLNLSFGTLSDQRDGQDYATIQIGDKWWMAENLNYNAENSYCYNDDPANCNKYGRLYNWETAMTACPDGWHLPSHEDIINVINHLGGEDIAGGKLKDYESNSWLSPNTGASNLSGFQALPAGRRYDHGLFTGMGYYAQFYSSTEVNSNEAYNLMLGYDYEVAFVYNYKKQYSISVRCVQD